MAAPLYVTKDEVKRHIGLRTTTTDQDAAIDDAIGDASDHIDAETRTFWDQRDLTITTEAVFRNQRRLFMPAPIISITSITEAGVALDTANFVIYRTWIEKVNTAFTEITGRFEIGGPVWSRVQQDIVVVGRFGYKTNETPRDIKLITKELAGVFSGLKTRSFISDDGIASTVVVTEIPTWVNDKIFSRRLPIVIGQRFVVVNT